MSKSYVLTGKGEQLPTSASVNFFVGDVKKSEVTRLSILFSDGLVKRLEIEEQAQHLAIYRFNNNTQQPVQMNIEIESKLLKIVASSGQVETLLIKGVNHEKSEVIVNFSSENMLPRVIVEGDLVEF